MNLKDKIVAIRLKTSYSLNRGFQNINDINTQNSFVYLLNFQNDALKYFLNLVKSFTFILLLLPSCEPFSLLLKIEFFQAHQTFALKFHQKRLSDNLYI